MSLLYQNIFDISIRFFAFFRNNGLLSIKFFCVTLPHMSICARVVGPVTFQKVDDAPNRKTCAERNYESLQYVNALLKKSHNKLFCLNAQKCCLYFCIRRSCVFVRQIYFVYVKGFVGFMPTGGHIPFHVKSVFLVEVGKVFVVRVLRYIVLIAEKGAHAAQLQNTFSSVHNCDFVLCHQLLSQFLIIEAMRNLRAAIFGSVETVDCFISQVLRNILGCIFPAPSQKQGAVSIVR